MQYQVIENTHKLAELGAEMAKRGQALQARLWDAWIGHQLDAAALWIDAGVKQFRLLGDAQNPYELYAGQSQLAQEYMEKAAEYWRQGLTALTDLQRDVATFAASAPIPLEVAMRETPRPAAAPRPVAEPTPAAEPGKVQPSVP
jgi:hypothetical protein